MSDRLSRLEAAVANIRRIPQPFQPTLTGPTAVRKIYHKQEDALRFADLFGSEMMVFSYESSLLGHDGQRLFLASGVQSFFHFYRQMDPSNRCHYEVIPTSRPAKLYLDLEFSVSSNPNKDGREAVDIFLKAVIRALHHFYGITVSPADLLVLDASTMKKFSQHVVFSSSDTVFENNLVQGQFISLVCQALSILASEESAGTDFSDTAPLCDVCSKVAKDLAAVLFSTDGITPIDAECCLVRTVETDLPRSICDTGVYTRNRNFRLAGSRKLTGTSVLWPLDRNRDEPLDSVWPTWSEWARTLVTSHQFGPLRLLGRPLSDCTCSLLSRQTQRGAPALHSGLVDANSSFITTQCLPIALRNFISSILFNWYTRDKRNACLHDKENFATKVWKIFGRDLRCFGVTVDGMRFCERVDRQHRSNHVILVFDLDGGCFYQKCLDPDCRAVNFRSQSWPIPKNLCILAPSNERLHDTASHSSFYVPDVTDDDLFLAGVMDAISVDFSEQF